MVTTKSVVTFIVNMHNNCQDYDCYEHMHMFSSGISLAGDISACLKGW